MKPPKKPDTAASTARFLRRNQTDAESLLWHCLRGRQLAGKKFRRQHPVGPFVADFFCAEARLVVEIDGGQHAPEPERTRDCQRTRYLESLGYRVLRFWNNQVLLETPAVLEVIRRHVEADCSAPLTLPSPPEGGEGTETPAPARGREKGN